jgi:hypothetical protein
MSHGWATLEFMENATRYKNVALSPLAFATAQLTTLNPFSARSDSHPRPARRAASVRSRSTLPTALAGAS